jgi:aspartate aminotransferase
VKSLSLKVQQLEESRTLVLTDLVREMARSGVDVVSLTAGEPDFPTPAHVKMAAICAIEENFTHYTEAAGIPELIDAIVRKFRSDNHLEFEPEQVLVSCGAKHSCYNTLQAICNSGDEVILAAPYWVSYPAMVKLVDARPIIVSTTRESGYKISPRQLRQSINARTKAFIFNSPSNPTGAVYSQGEIEELADVVRDTGIYVLADEIYEKIIYDSAKHFSIGSIREIRDQVVTVNGVSKAFAMTGWRIGYLGGPKEIVKAASKVQSHTTSHATSIAQRAALSALSAPSPEVDAMVAEFKRRRDYVVDRLSRVPGIEVAKPSGSFLLFPSVQQFAGKRWNGSVLKDDVDISRFLLEEHHVAVVPGTAFGARHHLRLSYAGSMKELEKGVERLVRGFRMLGEAY